MFSLINEVTSAFSIKDMKNSAQYKIINLGGKCLYVQGYKSVEKFSDTAINLKLKNAVMFIKGENFSVKELDSSSIYILGKVKSVEVE